MNIQQQIINAEVVYKKGLEEFLISVPGGMKLESHGLNHHRRVWSYAKEIITARGSELPVFSSEFVQKLLIASFLHDSGMAVDTSPRHGVHSRIICEQYIKDQGLKVSAYKDLLDVVEEHDNKEYLSNKTNSHLGVILNVADDLDALGYTGIYRYLEIYIERKRAFKSLGTEILSNAQTRYNHLSSVFHDMNQLLLKHGERFNILKAFSEAYTSQSENYLFGTGSPSGYCGIAELIAESVGEREDIKTLLNRALTGNYDNIIIHFFGELKKELSHDK